MQEKSVWSPHRELGMSMDGRSRFHRCGRRLETAGHDHAPPARLMCSNEQLMQLARSKRLAVVGDATQAHGAAAQGRVAWALGDIEILSFGGSKLITAGRVRLTSDHGHCRSEIQ